MDCIEAALWSPARWKELACFLQPPYLMPTKRGTAPFKYWAVDAIVRLSLPMPGGSTDIIIAVDPFMCWLELGKLLLLNSHETTTWVHLETICCYGLPKVVRSDRGPEGCGDFDCYLALNGV